MLDSVNGSEGAYQFEHREDLMDRPADEIVGAFFEYAERELFRTQDLEYELNGVVKKENVVVAIGSLHRAGHQNDAVQPFTLFIGRQNNGPKVMGSTQ
jgi:hypothetical protein